MTNDVSEIKKITAKEKTSIDTNVSLLIGNKKDIILDKKKAFFIEYFRF